VFVVVVVVVVVVIVIYFVIDSVWKLLDTLVLSIISFKREITKALCKILLE
jgi:hypothetical protein